MSIKAAPLRWRTAAFLTCVPLAFRPKLAANGLSGAIGREYLVARLLNRSKCLAFTGDPIVSDNGVATLNTYSNLSAARGLGANVKATVLHRQPMVSNFVLMIVFASLTASCPRATRASAAISAGAHVTRIAFGRPRMCHPWVVHRGRSFVPQPGA